MNEQTQKAAVAVMLHTEEQTQKATAEVNEQTQKVAVAVMLHTEEQTQKATAEVNEQTQHSGFALMLHGEEQHQKTTADVTKHTTEAAADLKKRTEDLHQKTTADLTKHAEGQHQKTTADLTKHTSETAGDLKKHTTEATAGVTKDTKASNAEEGRKTRTHQTFCAVAVVFFLLVSLWVGPRAVYVHGVYVNGAPGDSGLAREAAGQVPWSSLPFLGMYFAGEAGTGEKKPSDSELWIPDHPLEGQKRDHCNAKRGEELINGGCWGWMGGVKPPCEELYRHADKCYRPIAEDPLKPVHPSQEPRRADPWMPAKEP